MKLYYGAVNLMGMNFEVVLLCGDFVSFVPMICFVPIVVASHTLIGTNGEVVLWRGDFKAFVPIICFVPIVVASHTLL